MLPRIVRFDTALTTAIARWPGWLRAPFIFVSAIGHPIVMVGVAIVTAISLAERPGVLPALTIVIAATGINAIIKRCIGRPRPNTPYARNMFMQSPSFPSSHAFAAIAIPGVFVLIALPTAEPWGALLILTAGVWAWLVGVSRIYVGAHYASDVLAGWLLGSLVLLAATLWL